MGNNTQLRSDSKTDRGQVETRNHRETNGGDGRSRVLDLKQVGAVKEKVMYPMGAGDEGP